MAENCALNDKIFRLEEEISELRKEKLKFIKEDRFNSYVN